MIVAGFGRYGQIIGRLLHVNGIAATVLEHDAEAIEAALSELVPKDRRSHAPASALRCCTI